MRTYRPAYLLREEPVPPPTELQMQAIWFEQWHHPFLTTQDGRTVEIIQPGFWNHGGGPDFSQAAIKIFPTEEPRSPTPEIIVGSVELHLRPGDWKHHGHDLDANYEKTILHVVWEDEAEPILPDSAHLRSIPQVVLSRHLLAPWSELAPLTRNLVRSPLPQAKPGRCQAELEPLVPDRIVEIVRQAGRYRLEQKARLLFWRERLVGREQALYEALAEALGFHSNQIPMRLLSQRLSWKKIRALGPVDQSALLFGLAGFLPDQHTAKHSADVREWNRLRWEIWWKKRDELSYALLARRHWHLAGLRPLNRPERRIAALVQIIPLLPQLVRAVQAQEPETFSQLLLSIRDSFWEQRATLTGVAWAEPCRLLGEERVRDILINVFWPWVALHDLESALAGLKELRTVENRSAQAATQRVLASLLPDSLLREALTQQGLLQIFRDYCQTDCSNCQQCRFPELIRDGGI